MNTDNRPKGFPVIHMNGTSAETLSNQYDAAYESLMIALERLNETAPHQRDYYMLGEEEWQAAMDAHIARMQAIRQVMQELSELASYCWLQTRRAKINKF